MRPLAKANETKSKFFILLVAASGFGIAVSGSMLAPAGFIVFLFLCEKFNFWRAKFFSSFLSLFLFYFIASWFSLVWIFESIAEFAGRPLDFWTLSACLWVFISAVRALLHAIFIGLARKIFRKNLSGLLLFPWVRPAEIAFFSQILPYSFLSGSLYESEVVFSNFGFLLPLLGNLGAEFFLWQTGGLLFCFGKVKSQKFLLFWCIFPLFFLWLFRPSEISSDRRLRILPYSDSDLSPNEFLQKLKSAEETYSDLSDVWILFPETAMRKNVLSGDTIPRIRKFAERHSAVVVFGGNQIRPETEGLPVYNSAFWITPQNFYEHSSKRFLIPFAEFIPRGMDFLPNLSVPGESLYHAGSTKIFEYGKIRTATAICFDALIPAWYQGTLEKNADLALILSRENRLGPKTKKKIQTIARIRSKEFQIPILKIASGSADYFYFQNYRQELESGSLATIPIPLQHEDAGSFPEVLIGIWALLPLARRKLFFNPDRSI